MTLELNRVLLPGEEHPLSLIAHEGQLTCLTGGTVSQRTRWLHAMMGFVTPDAGYISLDSEPLTPQNILNLRASMAFVPRELATVGTIVTYEPPTVEEMLALRCNRQSSPRYPFRPPFPPLFRRATEPPPSPHLQHASLSALAERTGATGDKARLLAAAVMRQRPVLLVDSPSGESAIFLHQQATQQGTTVIAATDNAQILKLADNIVKLTALKL
jgi:ABC-type sugar transport system ATPase subunit